MLSWFSPRSGEIQAAPITTLAAATSVVVSAAIAFRTARARFRNPLETDERAPTHSLNEAYLSRARTGADDVHIARSTALARPKASHQRQAFGGLIPLEDDTQNSARKLRCLVVGGARAVSTTELEQRLVACATVLRQSNTAAARMKPTSSNCGSTATWRSLAKTSRMGLPPRATLAAMGQDRAGAVHVSIKRIQLRMAPLDRDRFEKRFTLDPPLIDVLIKKVTSSAPARRLVDLH